MQDEDKQIEIKKRARRRLVGAAALALFAAIVLPMVMDGEPQPAVRDIQIRIPAQSGDNVVSKDIAVPAPPLAADGEGAAPGVPPALAEMAPPPVAMPVAPVPAAPPASKPPAVEKPVPPAGKPAAPVLDEARRAEAILEGRIPPVARAETPFVVQLGAYRDRGNALSLQNKLKSDGFASYTEAVGDKTRVRIGPFAGRAEAEVALARLKRLGLGGTVVARD